MNFIELEKIMKIFKILGVAISLVIMSCGTQKKEFDPEYIKVTNERAQKIIDGMHIKSSEKESKVRDLIAEQYRNLSWIQDGRDKKIEAIKSQNISEKEKDERIQDLKDDAGKDIAKLHKKYIKDLSKELSEDQIVQVKDGMTYGVVPLTYAAFQDMLPNLTQEQKDTIHAYLVEAREHAMDAGSSDKKHWWFGKYKGKINNYLSSEGYDLEQAGKDWQKRREARKNNNG